MSFIEDPCRDTVRAPLLYKLKNSVSQRGIYVHVTLSKCSYDSPPIMNPDEKTSCTRALADMTFLPRSCVFPINIPPVQPSVSLCFFYSKLHPLHPKVNPIRWMFCHGSDFFFVPRSCYLLAADKPMNSGAKWNSYCYQKHKIPITLDVRAETRKWNRYS